MKRELLNKNNEQHSSLSVPLEFNNMKRELLNKNNEQHSSLSVPLIFNKIKDEILAVENEKHLLFPVPLTFNHVKQELVIKSSEQLPSQNVPVLFTSTAPGSEVMGFYWVTKVTIKLLIVKKFMKVPEKSRTLNIFAIVTKIFLIDCPVHRNNANTSNVEPPMMACGSRKMLDCFYHDTKDKSRFGTKERTRVVLEKITLDERQFGYKVKDIDCEFITTDFLNMGGLLDLQEQGKNIEQSKGSQKQQRVFFATKSHCLLFDICSQFQGRTKCTSVNREDDLSFHVSLLETIAHKRFLRSAKRHPKWAQVERSALFEASERFSQIQERQLQLAEEQFAKESVKNIPSSCMSFSRLRAVNNSLEAEFTAVCRSASSCGDGNPYPQVFQRPYLNIKFLKLKNDTLGQEQTWDFWLMSMLLSLSSPGTVPCGKLLATVE
uniref:Uncharacterized protein n=1 Tax=Timema tahoe TaxID=61484 RepID=A0A7R9IMM9_9NEOP|nr:unnamed protein product [Timema tahoe]